MNFNKSINSLLGIGLLLFAFGCNRPYCGPPKSKVTDINCSSDPGTANLSSYYPFNSSPADVVGSNGNATYASMAYAPDKLGNASALECNGVNSYALVNNGFDRAKRSFSLWFKTNTYPSGVAPTLDYGYVLTLDNPTIIYGYLTAYVGMIGGKRTLVMGIVDANNTQVNIDMDALGNPYGWQHLAYTQDYKNVKMYLNGKIVLNRYATNYTHSVSGNSNLVLGTTRSINGRYFDGFLDEFRFYNRTLTDCEVKYLFEHYN